ncbi:RusA family crossover junction endodeoxyribonuclease [Furfurilactobacillus entadae]|uniref:RusA family crossover junction endodeoxyribonuclease n=1 Tax=Furfurilactobacillus entadae TaxID=2922307 RepID=UPI0035EF9DB6
MAIKIVVQGTPVPQGRPKFSSRGGFVRAYDPKTSREYKKLVAEWAKKQYKHEPVAEAIEVQLEVYRPLQKSLSRVEQQRRLNGEHRPVIKGDIDNYYKAVTDACTGIVWVDDAQIVSMTCNKYYSDNPRVEMTVKTLEGDLV